LASEEEKRKKPPLDVPVGTEEWCRFGGSDGLGTNVAYAPPAAAQSGLL
jgi:hypothetical protein